MDLPDLMQGGFNAEAQPDAPVVSKDPMPPGVPGNCMITPTPVIQQTKAGTGYYIKVEMLVVDGPYAGRKCYDYINILNPNPVAEAIARGHLKTLCLTVGIRHLQSINELMGKFVRPILTVDGQYNNVKDYETATAAIPAPVSAPVAVPPTSPPPPPVPIPVPVTPPTPVAAPPPGEVIPAPSGGCAGDPAVPWAAPPPIEPPAPHVAGDIPF